MHWLTYLIATYLIYCKLNLIESTGNNTKVSINEHKDQLSTVGWEWHTVREKFYKNFSLTKNVFDFTLEQKAFFYLDLDSMKKKLEGYSFNNLKAIGHSIYIFFDGYKNANGSFNIKHYEKTYQENFRDTEWHEINDEYQIEPESLSQVENTLKIDLRIEITYQSKRMRKRPYVAISKMHKYLRFANNNQTEIVYFNLTKDTTDYIVEIDDEQANLTQFSYWTNLNFPDVIKNNLSNIAISKLNNSLMRLKFQINSNKENFENSSICLRMKYYHDAHDGLTKFLILSQFRASKNQDEKTFNKLFEYNSFRPMIYKIIQKNWLQIKVCFYNEFIQKNVIYFKSVLDAKTQLGRFPSLTNAIADFEIERENDHIVNDFLYSWQTGFYDSTKEWYTTPILENFKLKKKDHKIYLELINNYNSKIDVYYLVSKQFRLQNNMVLTFNLLTNHTKATLNIYLAQNTKRRRILRTINLEDFSDRNQISINLTDQNFKSNLSYSLIEKQDQMKIYDYIDKKKNKMNVENSEKEGFIENTLKKNLEDEKLHLEKLVIKSTNEDERLNQNKNENINVKRPLSILIFEFKIKEHLEKNNKIEKLELFNLNLMDPCYLQVKYCNYGKCKSDSINKWHCECDETAHGKNCEFRNMCKYPINQHYINQNDLIIPKEIDFENMVLNGTLYCIHRKAKSCLPIDDRILCLCEKDEFWNSSTQLCENFDSCSFIYCSANEECYEDKKTKKGKCRCKSNYYRNEITNECELDYCRTDGTQKCNQMQYCINDLINNRAICECKFGFSLFHQSNKCLPLFPNEQDKSPFISQYYGCDHTYELISNENNVKEYRCKCFNGYRLQDDKKTCKPEFDIKKCPQCTLEQICIRSNTNLPDQTSCLCKLGYNQDQIKKSCKPNFCNKDNQKIIKSTCFPSEECSVQMVRRANPVFQCVCKPELMIANRQNGICEIKNVCNKIEQEKCAEKNAYCVPKLVDTIKPMCECSIGFDKHQSSGICLPLDMLLDCKRFNAFTKYIDIKNNRAICACSTGYEFNSIEKKCILSWKDTIQISMIVFLKHLSIEFDKFEIPLNAYEKQWKIDKSKFTIYDCSTLEFPLKKLCYSLTNAAYKSLIKPDKKLMMKNVEYQLYNKVRSLLYYIYGDDQMSISMISFENITYINEKEFGFNTKYKVNMAVVGAKIKGESLQENLSKMCQEKERKNDQQNSKPDEFKEFCFLNRQVLPVYEKLNITDPLNLCDLKAIQCPAYSTCMHKKNQTINFYSCLCNTGFKSLRKMQEYNLNIDVCEDVDECSENGGTHNCGLNTTCDNLIGSHRCLCKENYKRLNETDCEETCSSSFSCVHGKCTVFEKHYEICVCNDGQIGDDCSKEDPLVILLKEILVLVSVGLGLILIVVIAIAIFCIKSVKKQKIKDEDFIDLNDLK